MSGFLSSLGSPPQGRVSVLSAEGVPRGPPIGRGWGSSASATLLFHPRSLPRALLGFVPRHSWNPGIRAGWPFPSSPLPHPPRPQKAGPPRSGGDRGWKVVPWLQGAWAGKEAPPTLSLPSPMEKLAGGQAFPACSTPEAGAGHSGSCSPHTTQVTPVLRSLKR